jgi:hypothetical protein
MADRVTAYRLGLTADQDSVAECESAVRRLLAEGAPCAEYDRFARDFSVSAFQARLVEFLAACQGASLTPRSGR